jgi:hypothetical protein
MGWRGFMRSTVAAVRRAERAEVAVQRRAVRQAERRRRELVAQYEHWDRMQEAQRAAYEAAVYENYVSLLVSVHKDAWLPWDWAMVENAPPPPPPAYVDACERAAVAALHAYQPSVTDRVLGKDMVQRQSLAQAVDAARARDRQLHDEAVARHRDDYARWQWFRDVAHGVNSGDLAAWRAVLDHLSPFEELADLGSAVEATPLSTAVAEAHVVVRDDDCVPSEVVSLTAGGKLTTKNMPQGSTGSSTRTTSAAARFASRASCSRSCPYASHSSTFRCRC